MSRSRAPLAIAGVAAGGIGYYLYRAGGSPKAAEKQFEADIHKASAKVKGELPHRGLDAEKEGKKWGQEAGAKIDTAYATASKELSKVKSETEAYAKETRAEALKKIDEADRKIEEGTAKAKSGISSWFGGK